MIQRVTKFPISKQPKGSYIYNTVTKQLRVTLDSLGNFAQYDSFLISSSIDALSINGFFPLYRDKQLSDKHSPVNQSDILDATILGPAPEGITYPLYMPRDLENAYQGNYTDPLGDDDGDGIPNVADPSIIGIQGFLSAELKYGIDFFIPIHSNGCGGSTVSSQDILAKINNPDSGHYNHTNKTISITTTGSGILIKCDGTISEFSTSTVLSVGP